LQTEPHHHDVVDAGLRAKEPDRIAGMFDAIAGHYDLLNRVLSGGLDQWWRAKAVRALRLTGRETLLDLCTGTADVALAATRGANGAARVVGIDFSHEMLRLGLAKVHRRGVWPRVGLVRGDAARVPLADNSVDAAAIAFGIRNVQQPELACRELARVVRRGGRLAVLEFGLPRAGAWRAAYLCTPTVCSRRSAGWCRGTGAPTNICQSRSAGFRRRRSSAGCSRKAASRM